MKITDLLKRESISLNCKAKDKNETLDMAVSLMAKSGNISNVEEYSKAVYAREEEGTTGLGDGVAIPHGKSSAVNAPGLAAMVIPGGVDFDAMDGQPTHLVFLIAAPDTKDNVHLDVLSKLSVMLMDENFTGRLRSAKSVDEFLNIIDETERRKENADKISTENNTNTSKASVKILAVTGCPTGIAHTYMAAESIERAAVALGCTVKVETRGSGGAKNVLTSKEIEEADGIIVAADTQVPLERFDGKKVIFCKVADGISKSEELVKKVIDGNTHIYRASFAVGHEGAADISDDGKESLWHVVYKHLMNGVSHMLPFVVGGGILIAIAFLIDGFSVDIASLEDKSQFGTITESASFFKTIGGYAFNFMLPILAGYIAMSIADRPALALGFVGGYIASIGKSGFLGALVIGFAAGYVIVGLKKLCSYLPEKLEGIKPVLIYPLFGILIIGLLMTYIVEPPVGALNEALNNGLNSMGGSSKIILGLILGGMMSVDLGGPVNKAAYVFGTASIVSGNYDIMAAVMVGGMVPPCAIALATMLFKNKFTKEEQKSGPVNFVMGLSFITEGAIPYAAADPLRVLPACIAGSAVAGALSMAFACELMAPHGGIFVFPVVENPLMYLAALAAGTVVATILLGILKKSKTA